jgi:hypothetical protein
VSGDVLKWRKKETGDNYDIPNNENLRAGDAFFECKSEPFVEGL